MMVAILSTGFAACEDDDSGSSSGAVGTWSGVDGRKTLTLKFKKNNSGTWTSVYNDYYSGIETQSGTFSYEMEGETKGIITVRLYDSYYGYNETEHFYFEIVDGTMYLYEDYYGEDLEWVLTKK